MTSVRAAADDPPSLELSRVVLVLKCRQIRHAAGNRLQRLVCEAHGPRFPAGRGVQTPQTRKRPDHNGHPRKPRRKPTPDRGLRVEGVDDRRTFRTEYSDELRYRPQVTERAHATRHLVAAVSQALRCERRREPWQGPHRAQIELALEPLHQWLASVDVRPADETDHGLRTGPGGPSEVVRGS